MMIKKHFHKDWNIQVVKTGDSLDLGKNKRIKMQYDPTPEDLRKCEEFGEAFAARL